MKQTAIQLNQVTKTYKGGIQGLQCANLEIPYNQCVGIIGANGAGKTTLIHLIAGVLRPSSGSVKKTICKPNDLAWVSQTQTIDWFLSVFDNVRLGARLGGASISDSYEVSYEMLEEVGLLSKKMLLPDQLSGGEIRRVQIARALAQKAKILLLDEPTVGLDPVASERFIDKITQTVSEETVVLIASHDLHILEKSVSSVLYLNEGHIEAFQTKEEFLKNFSSHTLREAFFAAHN